MCKLLLTDEKLEIHFLVLQYLKDSNGLHISSALISTKQNPGPCPRAAGNEDCCWGCRFENFVMKILLVKYCRRISYETMNKSNRMSPKVSWPFLRTYITPSPQNTFVQIRDLVQFIIRQGPCAHAALSARPQPESASFIAPQVQKSPI